MRFALLVLISGGLLAGQQQPVTSDCSVDGITVNTITGAAVPRAQVILTGQTGQVWGAADGFGRWKFVNVNCGPVQIMANRPGFLPANSSQPRPGAPMVPLNLSSGASTHDVKIQMTPHAVITGRIVDDQGDPVQNVQIAAMVSRVLQGKRGFQQFVSASSNDLGEFRLSSLPAGRYIVCASPLASNTLIAASVREDSLVIGSACYPGLPETSAEGTLSIEAGHEARVDLTLPRVHAVRIAGVITGMPVNGRAGLTLVGRATPGSGTFGSRSVTVRVDGHFEILGVNPGSYTLTTDYFEAGKRLVARVPVDVGSSDIDGISVHLEPGFNVTGTVRVDSSSGAAPPRLNPGSFMLRPVDPTMGGGTPQWNSEHTGFTIPDLPPGSYSLAASVPPPFYFKSATIAGRNMLRDSVPLAAPGGTLDILLANDSGTVDGQLFGPDDRPVGGVVTVLQSERPPQIVPTQPSGTFHIAGLAPGDYTLYAWDDLLEVEYANQEWLRRFPATHVSVSSAQTVQIRLTRSIAVTQ